MTKAELIRKISKSVGVNDSDARIFFEILLKRISKSVKQGQSIKIPEFGYFHLIDGEIKRSAANEESELIPEKMKLILFSEQKDFKDPVARGFVFNIPEFEEDDYHPVDSSFSLSIGKPLIPLSGIASENFFVPTSGYEYKRLLDSKAENLITNSQFLTSEEEFPTLLIDATSYNTNNVQLQWRLNENQLDQKDNVTGELQKEYEFKEPTELKNIAWDFGEDLSRQIETESILDLTEEKLNNDLTLASLLNKESKEKIEIPEEIEQPELKVKLDEDDIHFESEISINNDVSDEPVKMELNDEFVSDENEMNLSFDNPKETKAVIEDVENSVGNIDENDELETQLTEEVIEDEQIKPEEVFEVTDINEMKIDEVDLLLQDENNEIEIPSEEFAENEQMSDEEFWKSASPLFEPFNPDSKNSTEEVEQRVIENEEVNKIENVIENVESERTMVEEIVEPSQQIVEDNKEVFLTEKNEISIAPIKKRNWAFILFPAVVVILSILYWYFVLYKSDSKVVAIKQPQLDVSNSNNIKREYEIPVSYPYSKTEAIENKTQIEQKSTEAPIIEIPKEEKKIETQKPAEPVKSEDKKIPEKKSISTNVETSKSNITGKSLNVGNNIYKYGSIFVVQVAAFRSIAIAENEAGKYRNKGFNGFVEEAEISGSGKWYRVRVGNFNTKEEAKKFLENNIR